MPADCKRLHKKLGRNDQCWCGSGKKYKHCHYRRETQEPLNIWAAEKKYKAAFNKKKCLAPSGLQPNCSGKIVQAHTVPKSGSLRKIARDGHVYSFSFSLKSIEESKGKVRPKLKGLNKASTFTGFCQAHDNAIFSPIENQPIVFSQEQCFLFGFRALER